MLTTEPSADAIYCVDARSGSPFEPDCRRISLEYGDVRQALGAVALLARHYSHLFFGRWNDESRAWDTYIEVDWPPPAELLGIFPNGIICGALVPRLALAPKKRQRLAEARNGERVSVPALGQARDEHGSPARQTVPRTASRSVSPAQRARILERDGFRCRRCGAGPQHARLVVDHIVPVAAGGSDEDANLQCLCDPCNMGKRDRAPHEHDLRAVL